MKDVITTLNATADPHHIPLDATLPEIVWRGAVAATVDDIPGYLIGPASEEIALPIHVKVMKKRIVNVAVYRVRRPESRLFPAVDENLLKTELREVFGWQIDAWVHLKTYDNTIAYDTDLNRILTVGLDEFSGLLAAPEITGADPDFTPDIKVVLIDDVMFFASKPPPQTGLMPIGGITRPGNICVVMVGEAYTDNVGAPQVADVAPAAIRRAVAHEIGHVMVGGGHPDLPGDTAGGGVAPLQGSDTTQRLMHSAPPGRRLVKAEWDKAEVWLKTRLNGDN